MRPESCAAPSSINSVLSGLLGLFGSGVSIVTGWIMTEEVPEQADLQAEEVQEGVQEGAEESVPQEGLEDAGEEVPVGEGYEGTGEEAPAQADYEEAGEGLEEAAGQEVSEEAGLDPAQEGAEEVGEAVAEEAPADNPEAVQPQEEYNDPEAENQGDSQLARRFNRNPYFGQFSAALHNLISYDLKITGLPAPETVQYLNELMAAMAGEMWAADDRASVSLPKVEGKRFSNLSNPFKSFSHSQSNQEFLSMVVSR